MRQHLPVRCPFYGWLISHCMDRPHFVYPSSVKGHLGCFPFLAPVTSATMKIHVQVFFKFPFSAVRGIYPGVEFLSHTVAYV